MNVEVSAAINLIATSLYNNLPRRRVDEFAEEIEKGIAQKFQGHWYPENPSKGAAYRCINVSGSNIDPLILYAAFNSSMYFITPAAYVFINFIMQYVGLNFLV